MKAWLAVLLLAAPAAARAETCPSASTQPDEYCVVAGVPYCVQARELMRKSAALADEVRRCDPATCDSETAIRRHYDVRVLRKEWNEIPRSWLLMDVDACLTEAQETLAKRSSAVLAVDLEALGRRPGDDVERRLSALEALPRERRDPAALEAASRAADSAYALWRRLSLEFDASEVLNGDDLDNRREPINDLAVRVAGWRDRLIALYRQAGLAAPSSADEAAAAERLKGHALGTRFDADRLSPAALFDPRPALDGRPEAVSEQANPLYQADGRQPAPASLARSPVLRAGVVPSVPAGVYGLQPEAFVPLAPGAAAVAEQARSFTRVVGDPVGRAALVHRQTGEDCTIVSQQQILEGAGLVARGDPKAVEKKLSDATWKAGYRSPDNQQQFVVFNGNLLERRGLLVAKHRAADVERLDAAVRSGRLLTVDVTANKLWRDEKEPDGGHTVLVTGARLDDAGRVLGYYINDSGRDQGGRYLPRAELLAVWKNSFIELP